MKRKGPLHGIVLLGAILGGSNGAHPSLRRVSRAEETIVTCLTLKRLIEFEPGSVHGEPEACWDCELPGGSILTLKGLDDLDSPGIVDQFVSGKTEIAIPGGVVTETSIIVPPTSRIQVDTIPSNNANPDTSGNFFLQDEEGRRLIEGVRKVLVVRVTDQTGVSTSASAQVLSDKLFDTDGTNFVSQFDNCSHGKLQFEPTTELNTGDPALTVRGVYDVTIPNTVKDGNHHVIREAVTEQLKSDWQNTVLPARYKSATDKSSPFHHVFYCIPPGTTLPEKGWIAYGYEGGWLTVYNDKWCHKMSANMHELGHNLAVHHSGDIKASTEVGQVYGDQSGYMGSLYGKTQPIMCFNGPKSWKLGWYKDKSVLVSPSTSSWKGRLRGICNYDEDVTTTVLVKIETGTVSDYYVTFNRKAGANRGTMEGGNQVLISTEDTNGVGYGVSSLIAKLDEGGSHIIPNFSGSNRDVRVTVGTINTVSSIGYADVKIEMLCTTDWQCERNAMFACPSHCDTVTGTCEVTSGCDCNSVCESEIEDKYQCPSDCGNRLALETTTESNNGHAGSMFNTKAKKNVQITSFEINVQDEGTYVNAYVFTKPGSYDGHQNNKDKWMHIQTARVKSEGEGAMTKLPDLPNPIAIDANRMQAFYVTLDTDRMRYKNGSSEGTLFVSNDDMEVYEGIGKSYLFGETHSARAFSGHVNYVKVQEAPPRIVTKPTTTTTTTTTTKKRRKKRKKRKTPRRKKRRSWWFHSYGG